MSFSDSPILEIARKDIRRRNQIAFAWLIGGLLTALGGFVYLQTAPLDIGIPWPLRRVLEMNGRFGEAVVSPAKTDPAVFRPIKRKARVNGDIGLGSPIDLATWRLHIETEGIERTQANASLSLDDIRRLPKVEENVQFKCVEGWSEVMSFAGVRFSDFLRFERLGTKSGEPINLETRPADAYRYVSLETPDGAYYVSIDLKSLMAPTTLLAYEQNGETLSLAHGAPLRLYVPNKYGIKSIKRISRIIFTDERPPDYWYDEGYDWFAGL